MKWIDMHCDTLSALADPDYKRGDENLLKNNLCVDIQRLKHGNCAAQFFACYVNAKACLKENAQKDTSEKQRKEAWDAAYENVLSMIGYAGEAEGPDFRLARTAEDILLAQREDRVAGILTVEEGGVLNGRMQRLETLYAKGVRLITLTWNYENCIGSPNSRNAEIMAKGLTAFGRETVERMNELGMAVDVSHLSDGGFYDCIKYSDSPIVASHSNARTLCAHPRNLTDEMLRTLGENGGVAGLNFYSAFLTNGGIADVSDIARHASYMISRAGEEAVALGTDLDGFETQAMPRGIKGVQDMERLWAAFEKAGITPRQIEKIAYKNVMRILEDILK